MPLRSRPALQLLCSDGIWNSMKVKVVLRFVKQRLQRGYSPADVCRDLCQGALLLLQLLVCCCVTVKCLQFIVIACIEHPEI